MKAMLKEFSLKTVCQEALCPNISECFSKKIATFMILGDICTRDCKFCGVKKTKLGKSVDYSEPKKIAEAVKRLNLAYVVITSPTRDDLADKGARAFYLTVKELRNLEVVKGIEVLIPDFLIDQDSLNLVISSKPDVIGHNLETVPRLYREIRKNSDYCRSLSVLKKTKELNPDIYTKSALMLGMGESESEVIKVLEDLRGVNCDFLSLGQYLPPSTNHYPVKEYISPDKFSFYREQAEKLGFKKVLSSPYVRSSYLADSYIL